MGILLAVLKILGIILLIILGLVLLVLMLVLFVPICYRIKAVHNESETTADAKISFLVVKVKAHFDKVNKLDYGAWILVFKVFPRKEKEAKEDSLSEDIHFDLEDLEAAEGNDFSRDEVSEISDSVASSSDTGAELSVASEVERDDNKTSLADKESDIEEETNKVKKTKKDKPKTKKSFGQVYEKLSDKADEAMDKVEDGLDKLDQKYVDTVKKIDHVEQFLDRDYVQRTITRGLKVIKRLLLTIKPKKSRGYLRLGLGSAADTGSMLGKISMFYGLYGSWLNIEPDFYNKVIEADIDFKGRIYLFRIIFPAIRMILSRDFWKTKKLAEKI